MVRRAHASLWTFLCVVVSVLVTSRAIQFDLGPTNTYFCVGNEFYAGQRFKVTYNVPDNDDHWDTTISVHSPGRAIVFSRNNIDNQPGEFELTANDDGVYKFCFNSALANHQLLQQRFRNRGRGRGPGINDLGAFRGTPNTRRVEFHVFDADQDPEAIRRQKEYERQARNYADVNKNDVISQSDLQPINLVLIRTEAQLDRLVNEFREFRQREREHRSTNESTNTRTVVFSLITIIALVILALWQGYYMRNYFKKKKLI